MIQKQRSVLLGIAVGLGIMAVIVAKIWLDRREKQIMLDAQRKLSEIQANSVSVLVAKSEIARGAVVKPDMLESVIMPRQYVQPMAATAVDRISDMIALAPFAKGEQVTLNKLALPGQAGGGLAEIIPVGKRAITVSIEGLGALAGMLKIGDMVDIIATLPIPVQGLDGKQTTQTAVIPLFQKVKILAIGQQTAAPVKTAEGGTRYGPPPEEVASSSPLYTFALSPLEANLLAFVQEQAKIRLMLRSSNDDQVQQFQAASWETLFAYLIPSSTKPPPPPPPEAPKEYVEIYRGLEREKVIISDK